MARDRGAAHAARFALLGLMLDRPAHGYDLARHFVPDSALGDIMYLSPSHLYALLGRLEAEGLIAGEQQDAGARPQRRIFHLTDLGREAVMAWLSTPVDHPRDMRIDFPLKLVVAQRLGSPFVEDLIERQRAVFRQYIATLERAQKPVASEADAAFMDLMRLGRIGRAQAALDWLDLCAATAPVITHLVGPAAP